MNTVIVTTREELTNILKEIMPASSPAMPDEALELELLKRKKLLTEKEVEKLYGLNRGSLRNLRNQGRGPVYIQENKGTSVFYEHTAIESYIIKMRKLTYDQ